jgi:SAM-dependent methyltransferase
MSDYTPTNVHAAVREHYGAIAESAGACCGPTDGLECCTPFYPAEQLIELPDTVTALSLGCGDPVTQSGIQPGDVVLDLGSGGGIDCFLAAKRVGPAGRVIGIDMTDAMLQRARANAARLNAANVEFRKGHIEALPVDDASVDLVISNCVINLSPDKPRVFAEMFRALRPGGRVSVSDIVTDGAMAPEVARDVESWSACVAGALTIADYAGGLAAAGFVDVKVEPKTGPAPAPGLPFSALITARKP